MQLVDIILILYIILVIIGFVLLWQRLSSALLQIEKLTHEQRILIIVTLFAIVTFATFYIGIKIHEKRIPAASPLPTGQLPIAPEETAVSPVETAEYLASDPQPPALVANSPLHQPSTPINAVQQSDQALQQLLSLNYPELERQSEALKQTIQRFDQFFVYADQLAARAPRHWRFMQQIALNRWAFRQKLMVLAQRIEDETQVFWVYYRTGSAESMDYAQREFAKKSTGLVSDMQSLLGKESEVKQRDNRLINSYLKHLIRMLNNPPPKPNQIAPQYTLENQNSIINALNQTQQALITQYLTQLQESQKRIDVSVQEFQRFMQQFPDSTPRVQPTLNLWKQALQANLYVQYRVLHCAEAGLLLTDNRTAIAVDAGKELQRVLLERLPALVSEAADIRLQAERSYSTKAQ